jgi:hypothetical protein
MDQTKICTGCKTEKDLNCFGAHPNGKFGKQAKCYECYKASSKRYYAGNKHLWEEREKRMREEDPEALKKKNRDAAARWRANPENIRQKKMAYIETRYGMPYEQFEKMEVDQGGVCAICGRPPTNTKYGRLHVDHDHATGRVRGLLCHTCNAGLGQFQDKVEWIQAAVAYLLAAQSSGAPSQKLGIQEQSPRLVD